jgi:3-oxoadipate enol-lactonase
MSTELKVNANGVRIRALLEGPVDAPVITLSHSLATTLEMWRPQMQALLNRFRVLRYDVRGHGESEVPPGPYTLRQLAEEVRGLLAEIGIRRTHFVGLSMGGMIGQQLALDYPQLVESLVLADTLSAYPPEAKSMWWGRINAASGPHGMEPLVEPTMSRWFTGPFLQAGSESLDWVREMIRRTPSAGFIGCCRALMELNLTERLGGINVPTLIIVGRQDPTTPVSGAEVIQEAIAGSQLVVIENAAHLSNIEQPKAFDNALLSFLTTKASNQRH